MVERWPFVRRTRESPGSTPDSGPEERPRLQWRHDAHARVFGTPLVVDDRVYVASGTQSSDVGSVVAIDRCSGDRLWAAAEAAFEVRGTPGFHDGKLYVGDLDDHAFVVDATSGAVLHHESETGITPPDGIYPIAHGDTVFVTPYRLEARDAASWSLRWDVGDETIPGGVLDPPAISDDTLVAAVEDATGERVYVGTDEGGHPQYVVEAEPSLRALDARTGDLRWERSLPGRARGPAIADGVVYLVTRGSEPQGKLFTTVRACSDEQPVPDEEPTDYREFGTAHAIDLETGAEYWSRRFDDQANTMPAVYRDTLCFGTRTGTVVALDAATGERRWETPVNEEGSVLSWPTIAADTVYVGSRDDRLYALDRRDGSVRWQFETESAVDSNPAVVDGTVYVGDTLGNVYAVCGQ